MIVCFWHCEGHYLSASTVMWTSTQNHTLKQKVSFLVAGLSACQDKIGIGYLSAFPYDFFDRFQVVQPGWATYYTIHKVQSKSGFLLRKCFQPYVVEFQLFSFVGKSCLTSWINILLLETLKLKIDTMNHWMKKLEEWMMSYYSTYQILLP